MFLEHRKQDCTALQNRYQKALQLMANKKELTSTDLHQGLIISPVYHYFQTQTDWIDDSAARLQKAPSKILSIRESKV